MSGINLFALNFLLVYIQDCITVSCFVEKSTLPLLTCICAFIKNQLPVYVWVYFWNLFCQITYLSGSDSPLTSFFFFFFKVASAPVGPCISATKNWSLPREPGSLLLTPSLLNILIYHLRESCLPFTMDRGMNTHHLPLKHNGTVLCSDKPSRVLFGIHSMLSSNVISLSP